MRSASTSASKRALTSAQTFEENSPTVRTLAVWRRRGSCSLMPSKTLHSAACINNSAGTWILRDDAGMVDLLNTEGDVLMSVNNFGRDALAFVAQTGVFYVRELPGDLSDEEKITLIATLVESSCCELRLDYPPRPPFFLKKQRPQQKELQSLPMSDTGFTNSCHSVRIRRRLGR